MTKTLKYLTASTFLLLLGCGEVNEPTTVAEDILPENIIEVSVDKHSYANITEIRTSHLHLNLVIDFEQKKIQGNAVHTVENSAGTDVIVFDTHSLDIEKVVLDNGEEATYEMGEYDELLGESLAVAITPETKTVTIYYSTSPDSKALQWLDPQQTAGKDQPYLFTQGEAVLTRTWIPCQDTPGNRITYSADVTVPSNLMAVMSADNPKEKSGETTSVLLNEDIVPHTFFNFIFFNKIFLLIIKTLANTFTNRHA